MSRRTGHVRHAKGVGELAGGQHPVGAQQLQQQLVPLVGDQRRRAHAGLQWSNTELLLETMGFARSDRDHNAYYLSTLMPLEYETCCGCAGTTSRWVRPSCLTRRSVGTSV